VRVLRATRHQERFPPPSLRDRCGFRERTFAGTRANGRDALITDVWAAAIRLVDTTYHSGSPRRS
jgi:hypothetical protein